MLDSRLVEEYDLPYEVLQALDTLCMQALDVYYAFGDASVHAYVLDAIGLLYALIVGNDGSKISILSCARLPADLSSPHELKAFRETEGAALAQKRVLVVRDASFLPFVPEPAVSAVGLSNMPSPRRERAASEVETDSATVRALFIAFLEAGVIEATLRAMLGQHLVPGGRAADGAPAGAAGARY